MSVEPQGRKNVHSCATLFVSFRENNVHEHTDKLRPFNGHGEIVSFEKFLTQ